MTEELKKNDIVYIFGKSCLIECIILQANKEFDEYTCAWWFDGIQINESKRSSEIYKSIGDVPIIKLKAVAEA